MSSSLHTHPTTNGGMQNGSSVGICSIHIAYTVFLSRLMPTQLALVNRNSALELSRGVYQRAPLLVGHAYQSYVLVPFIISFHPSVHSSPLTSTLVMSDREKREREQLIFLPPFCFFLFSISEDGWIAHCHEPSHPSQAQPSPARKKASSGILLFFFFFFNVLPSFKVSPPMMFQRRKQESFFPSSVAGGGGGGEELPAFCPEEGEGWGGGGGKEFCKRLLQARKFSARGACMNVGQIHLRSLPSSHSLLFFCVRHLLIASPSSSSPSSSSSSSSHLIAASRVSSF